jgi:hypothetical protein
MSGKQKLGSEAQAPPPRLHEQLLTCLRGDWKSLAVVPAEPGLSAHPVADALVEASKLVKTTRARLIPGADLESSRVSQVIVEMVDHVHAGGLAIVVVDSILTRPSAIPLLMAADAVLLVVHLGSTRIDSAQRTVEIIGRDRFIGVVTVSPRSGLAGR